MRYLGREINGKSIRETYPYAQPEVRRQAWQLQYDVLLYEPMLSLAALRGEVFEAFVSQQEQERQDMIMSWR